MPSLHICTCLFFSISVILFIKVIIGYCFSTRTISYDFFFAIFFSVICQKIQEKIAKMLILIVEFAHFSLEIFLCHYKQLHLIFDQLSSRIAKNLGNCKKYSGAGTLIKFAFLKKILNKIN